MANFWLTMHWAHADPDDHPWNIYRKQLEKRDYELKEQDRVLFYECLRPRGMITVTRVHNGTRTQVKLGPGAGGIVREGFVTGDRRDIRGSDIVYDYGNLERWKYLTPCETTVVGLVRLKEIWQILGKNVPPQGFGLRRVSPIEYDRLLRRLKQSHVSG